MGACNGPAALDIEEMRAAHQCAVESGVPSLRLMVVARYLHRWGRSVQVVAQESWFVPGSKRTEGGACNYV